MSKDDAKLSNGEGPVSDEEMRKLLKPDPDPDDVLSILTKSYAATPGASVKIIKQLDSYDDCNYQVEIDGTLYLLKIHNGVESNDFAAVCSSSSDADADGDSYYRAGHMSSVIHLQNAIMQVLNQHDVPTPVPQKPKTGSEAPVTVHRLSVVSKKHSPCQLVCRLLSWVPGRTMSSVKLLPLETLADAGRLLGRIDTALDHLTHDKPLEALRRVESAGLETNLLMPHHQPPPQQQQQQLLFDESLLTAARRYHQWDGKNTADLRKFVHCIQDERRRNLVESVVDAFETFIQDSGAHKKFRVGINHGDFNDANILLDDNLQVSGVIDFGDSVESWRVLDVAVAMAYGMLTSYGQHNRSISAAAAVLRGYNSVYPLTDFERKHLVLLIACRLACSVTLGAYSYQQNPENHYLLFHAEPAWKSLEMIWCFDSEQREKIARAANRVFHQACLYTDSREKIITCYDLVMPDPGVADLLQSVRVPSVDHPVEPPQKKQKRDKDGRPIITFVTGNEKKLEEIQRILGKDNGDQDSQLPYHLTNAKLDLPELQGESAIQIAREKCIAAAEKIGGAVITEDTSLCFNALNGMPGPFIRFFLESCGLEGLNKMIDAFEDKTGYAQTVVAFCAGPGKDPAIFDGRTDGKIVMPRGKRDFGWDPIFEPTEGGGKTYAEMTKEEKDAISHRTRAFVQLREYLDKFRADILSQIE